VVCMILLFARSNGQLISVEGMASKRLTPDMTNIDFTVDVLSKESTSEASKTVSEILEDIRKGLPKIMSDDESYSSETLSYSIQPRYEYDPKTLKYNHIGFGTTHQMRLKLWFNDMKMSGQVVDKLIELGRDKLRIDLVSFDLKDSDSVRQSLLSSASENARKKADLILKGLGTDQEIMNIRSARESVMYPTYRKVDYESRAASEGTVLESGLSVITAHVMIDFELSPSKSDDCQQQQSGDQCRQQDDDDDHKKKDDDDHRKKKDQDRDQDDDHKKKKQKHHDDDDQSGKKKKDKDHDDDDRGKGHGNGWGWGHRKYDNPDDQSDDDDWKSRGNGWGWGHRKHGKDSGQTQHK